MKILFLFYIQTRDSGVGVGVFYISLYRMKTSICWNISYWFVEKDSIFVKQLEKQTILPYFNKNQI